MILQKIKKARRIIALLGVLTVMAGVYFFVNSNKTVTAFHQQIDASTGLSYELNSSASFYGYRSKEFFFCTKDGMQYMTAKGEKIWEAPFSMTAPVITGQCDAIAVGESKGHAIYAFNAQGKIFEQRFTDSVLSFSVNRSGYVTVLLKKADGYQMEVYAPNTNKDGSAALLLYYFSADLNTIPVSADTSADGRIAALSFIDLNLDARYAMTSRIMFMYIDQTEGRNFTDCIFADIERNDQVITRLRFMKDNKLLAVSDTNIECFLPSGDAVKTEWAIPFRNQIDTVAFDGDAGFAFTTGEPLLNDPKPDKSGVLYLYNMNGSQTGSYAFNGKANSLSMDWGCAIVGSGRNYFAVSDRGWLLWKYNAAPDVKQVIFAENKNTILIADSTSGRILKKG